MELAAMVSSAAATLSAHARALPDPFDSSHDEEPSANPTCGMLCWSWHTITRLPADCGSHGRSRVQAAVSNLHMFTICVQKFLF